MKLIAHILRGGSEKIFGFAERKLHNLNWPALNNIQLFYMTVLYSQIQLRASQQRSQSGKEVFKLARTDPGGLLLQAGQSDVISRLAPAAGQHAVAGPGPSGWWPARDHRWHGALEEEYRGGYCYWCSDIGKHTNHWLGTIFSRQP